MFDLSTEQKTAIKMIQDWIDTDKKEFKLGGYAGTGKTTIIKSIIESLNNDFDISLMAFTGKAVSVLRKKGCSDAATIHGSIYIPQTTKTGVEFHLREYLECDLIIIDEASMISREIYNDLISFEIPIIWVGDPGQLEPVGEDVGLMKTPDYTLQTIHRQGEGSQILDFADKIRRGITTTSIYRSTSEELLVQRLKPTFDVGNPDQIICGFNKTRVNLNKLLRRHLGRTSDLEIGERLVCLRNNPEEDLFNGMVVTVTKIIPAGQKVARIMIKDELGVERGPISLYLPQLNQPKTIEPYEIKKAEATTGFKPLGLFDYGYCLTAHKSQGSEWDSVVVIEEIWDEQWDRKRWIYTTATRAAKKLQYFYK